MAGRGLVQSLERGLAVLETVARSDRGASLRTIAEELGLKAPTAHNLVRTLAAHGWLERVGPPVRYRLGAAVEGLVRAQSENGLRREAAAAMEALQGDWPDAILTLAEHRGTEVFIVLRMAPERPGFLEEPRGHELHPYGSASALLFQALWPADTRMAYRRAHPFSEQGARLWKSASRLDRFLAEAGARGFVEVEFPEDAQVKMAASVPGPGGVPVATLGAAVPSGSRTAAQRARLRGALLASAGRVGGGAEDGKERRR